MVDFKYENITFKITDRDDDNGQYTCDFSIKLSEDFMESNVPDELFVGNELTIYNVKDDEFWGVEITSVVYDDGGDRYSLNIRGSCTFQLFLRSVQF
jgi:hypothetical protein